MNWRSTVLAKSTAHLATSRAWLLVLLAMLGVYAVASGDLLALSASVVSAIIGSRVGYHLGAAEGLTGAVGAELDGRDE